MKCELVTLDGIPETSDTAGAHSRLKCIEIVTQDDNIVLLVVGKAQHRN